MLPPGAHKQQGRLSGELCASHKGTGAGDRHCVLGKHRPEGLPLAMVGAGTDAHGATDQAGRAAGTEGGDAEEGWSDFMG